MLFNGGWASGDRRTDPRLKIQILPVKPQDKLGEITLTHSLRTDTENGPVLGEHSQTP
jgi:hypothetical protein